MPDFNIDFEGLAQSKSNTDSPNDKPNPDNSNNQEDTTPLDGNHDKEDLTGKDGNQNLKDNNQNNEDSNSNDADSSTGDLTEGDSIEFEGVTYTVDATGNLVDDKGNIFKEAKDVKSWISSMDVSNDQNDSDFNLNSIQEALGITVTDDKGNPVEFTNDAEGVKSYINSVIDLKSKDIQTATINKLFADNPLLKEFTDYVQLTGSPQGFGELPDRSGIEIDKNNINQQEAIIRMAAQEFGNKSLNENYIKYLKDSGGLYDEAKQQLTALVEKDAAMRKDIEEQAEANRQAEQARINEYWQNVSKVIEGRIIAGYKLPESFTKEVNGQKVVYTPNDFYNYLNKAIEQDADGNIVTGYQRDLSKLTDEEYLNRELLDAWLMFTGGTYKDLIDMAVKEDNVRKLKIKSKEQRTAKSIKVIKKQGGKVNMNDIIL
ncbi:MAG: hypothetical protein [Bacteriophage sp.]|nr:MAG: hypothetical protein [Bacteriophage sp.]